jgi:hypothetical protein
MTFSSQRIAGEKTHFCVSFCGAPRSFAKTGSGQSETNTRKENLKQKRVFFSRTILRDFGERAGLHAQVMAINPHTKAYQTGTEPIRCGNVLVAFFVLC